MYLYNVDGAILFLVSSPYPGGPVSFDINNDGPTLTGAKSSFSINVVFPPNQTVVPGGQVVWTKNVTMGGECTNMEFDSLKT